MQLYCDDSSPGADGNGDLTDPNNIFEDNASPGSHVVPHGAEPSPADDLRYDSNITNTNTNSPGAVHNLTNGASFQLTGGVINVYGTAITGAIIGGATIVYPNAPVVMAVLAGGTFNSGTISTGGSAIQSAGSYQWVGDPGLLISDDGTAVWSGIAYGAGTTVTSPEMSGSAAASFAGAVACPSINMPNAAFNGGIFQSGTVDLVVGSLGAAVTWTGVTGIGSSIGINCVASETWAGHNRTYVLTGSGGTVSLTEVTSPITANDAVTFPGTGGNYASVAANSVFYPSGAFTLEFWANNSSNYAKFLGNWTGSDGYFVEATDASGGSGTPKAIHAALVFATAGIVGLNYDTAYDSSDHHYAIQYDGTTAVLFYDGANVAQVTVGTDHLTIGTHPFFLGQPGDNAFLNHPFRLRQVRLSSVARYSNSGFTASENLTSDGSTVALWTCQEVVGGTKILDRSGNGHNLTITGSVTCPNQLPATTDVRAATSYGPGNSLTGSLSAGGGGSTFIVIIGG